VFDDGELLVSDLSEEALGGRSMMNNDRWRLRRKRRKRTKRGRLKRRRKARRKGRKKKKINKD